MSDVRDEQRQKLGDFMSVTVDAMLMFNVRYGRGPNYFKVWKYVLCQETSMGGNERMEWREQDVMCAEDAERLDALMKGIYEMRGLKFA